MCDCTVCSLAALTVFSLLFMISIKSLYVNTFIGLKILSSNVTYDTAFAAAVEVIKILG